MALCGTQSKGEMLLFKIGFGLRDGGMIVKLFESKMSFELTNKKRKKLIILTLNFFSPMLRQFS